MGVGIPVKKDSLIVYHKQAKYSNWEFVYDPQEDLVMAAGVTGGDEVSRGKPEPDIYLLAASRLGVAAPHCLAIEDSEPGFLAAHRAGMAVVFVPDQAPPSPSLLAHVPRIAATLDDVWNWLSSLPPAADADPHARRA